MNRLLPFAALMLAAAWPGAAIAQSEESVLDARVDLLSQQGERWLARLTAGDWEDLRALYAEDAVLMTHGQAKIEGADAIITFLQRVPRAGGTVEFAFANEEVEVEGKLGFVTAKYRMTMNLPGRDPITAAGRSFLVYKWDGAAWKLWRDIDNLAPDATHDAFAR
ncbi:MAG: DUF4440 domain-containing protein [Erythrobacter sp.]|jgi:ketosteroid isomerase-like protein|nr:DUF4440 domain-containing protein [Erythrobacter sp.]